MKNTQLIVGIIVLLAILGGAVYYTINTLGTNAPDEEVVDLEEGLNTGGIKVEVVHDDSPEVVPEIPVPNLDAPIVFPKDSDPSRNEIAKKEIEGYIAALKLNSSDFNTWVDLGLAWKGIDDYERAKDAWTYASALRPQNSLTFGNLGNLYGYYIRDYKKAEENYRKAISNTPGQGYLYYQAYEFFNDILRDKKKALEIVKEGVKENPTDVDLNRLLDSLENTL